MSTAVYRSAPVEVGSLRYRLKHETKEVHDVADKAMQVFLFDDDVDPTKSQQAYRHLLLQLHVLYEALEEELESNKSHPLIGSIHFPDELNRFQFLAEDLDYFYDNNWRHLLQTDITPAMQRYVARIREIGRSQPHLLIAHSYTRYFGDLSGGQIVRRLIKKRYSLPGDSGLRFYSFEHLESIAKFKDLYSARMNNSVCDNEAIREQVEEAKRIFQFNIDVFEEVGSMFRPEPSKTPSVQVDHTGKLDTMKSQWTNTLRLAYVAAGVSATVMMLCPWFRKMVLNN